MSSEKTQKLNGTGEGWRGGALSCYGCKGLGAGAAEGSAHCSNPATTAAPPQLQTPILPPWVQVCINTVLP